jgi:hypothetical protein
LGAGSFLNSASNLGSGIISAIINATIGALLLLLVINLVRGGGGWRTSWGGNGADLGSLTNLFKVAAP